MASGVIRVDGDTRQLLHKLNSLANLDKKGINAALAEEVRTSTRERFRTEKGPDDKAWVRSIRADRTGGLTLSKTARLKNSIKSQAGDQGFAVGTNTIYARTHQLGEKGRKITIKARTTRGLLFQIDGKWIRKKKVTITYKTPARPFLGLSDEDQTTIRRTVEDVLLEG